MAYEFLDIWGILVNEVAGSSEIFLGLSFIIIFLLSIRFKFDNQSLIMMIVIYSIIISVYINSILPLILFGIAVLGGSQLNRLFTR